MKTFPIPAGARDPAHFRSLPGPVVVVYAWLAALPWLIAGQLWWVQLLTLGVGALALGWAAADADNRAALWRFPVFWLGLALVAYIACQALNPWAEAVPVRPGAKVWHLQYLDHVRWLPAGVRADYYYMNTWRDVVFWAGLWLLVCAWWVAVRRRRDVRLLWIVALLLGVAVTIAAVANHFYPNNRVLWWYQMEETDLSKDPRKWGGPLWTFVGGFAYRNAAGAFLYLALAAGLALAAQAQARGREVGRDSGFWLLYLAGCVVIVAELFMAGSRAGQALGLLLFLAAVAVMFWAGVRERGFGWGGVVVGVMFGAASVAVLLTMFMAVPAKSIERLLASLPAMAQPGEEASRPEIWAVSAKMAGDRLAFGHGGGSYRYVSPFYLREGKIFADPRYAGGTYMRLNHAHNEWLEFPVHYGLAGSALVLAMLLCGFGRALAAARRLGAAEVIVLLGVLAALVHAFVDFIFFYPAVILLFALLLASVAKLGALETRRETAG